MTETQGFKVSAIGFGAIGERVVRALAAGEVPGAKLSGVVQRTAGKAEAAGFQEVTLEDAIASSDLVVECAGGEAARELGPQVIRGGADLLLVSVGVLADPHLRRVLLEEGPGRTYVSTGAIGGLDVLGAATLGCGLDEASITSTKLPGTLVQPWMNEEEAERLRQADAPLTVFQGSVTEAIKLFPKSLNVAVALAHATGLWDETIVRLVADPEATLTNHSIQASGTSGEYAFSMTNYPLESNPASSAVVSQALLKGITRLSAPSGSFI